MGNYYSPTPKKWRKIGDAILLGSTAISTLMLGAPFSDHVISIIVWSLGVIGVVGKVVSNFAKEDENA